MADYTSLSKSGSFVFGFLLDGQGGGTPLAEARNVDGPVWIHLDYSGLDCYEQLSALGLADTTIESLMRPDTRPRSMTVADGRLLILRAVNLNPGASPEDMVSIRFWYERNLLITVRQRKVLSTQDIKAEIEKGQGPVSVEYLLAAIVERLADRISDYVDEKEEDIIRFEGLVDSDDPNKLRHDVVLIRRHAAAVKRYLSPQRDALESFNRHARELVSDNEILYLHEQADRIMRYVEDLDLVREKAVLLQEELMNRIAQEQNSRMYVLSIIAAIFLPISFVTGLFGMNVGGLPGIEEPKAFLIVSLGMAGISIGILLWFRSKRWL